jgi:hypothetical protein
VTAATTAAAQPAAVRERCQHLQALEDAIKFRRSRAGAACSDCQHAPDGQCDDHGRDAGLISEWNRCTSLATAAEYRQLIGTLTETARAKILKVEPLFKTLAQIFKSSGLPLTFLITRRTVAAAITILLVPRKMVDIRTKGGDDAVELAQLVRLAASWILLMVGAILVLATAVIQLALAY